MNLFFEEYKLSEKTISLKIKENEYAYYCLSDFLQFLGVDGIKDPMEFSNFFLLTKVQKGTKILTDDKLSDKIFFIVSGAVRKYLIFQGEEKSMALLTEGNLVGCFNTFILRKTALSNIEAVEDSLLLEIDYKNFIAIRKIIPNFSVVLNSITIRFLRILMEVILMLKLSSKKRYEFMLQRMPQIPNRFQLKHQASFIGIKPETISRIRNEIANDLAKSKILHLQINN